MAAVTRSVEVNLNFCISAAAGMLSSLYSISRSCIVVVVLYAFCFNAVKVRRWDYGSKTSQLIIVALASVSCASPKDLLSLSPVLHDPSPAPLI